MRDSVTLSFTFLFSILFCFKVSFFDGKKKVIDEVFFHYWLNKIIVVLFFQTTAGTRDTATIY